MATSVIMPKQGQSVESCIIVGWKKRVGDLVKPGEIICEVETDKATFEVESPAEGTLLAILHEAGSDVPVLAPIAVIGAPGENIDALRGGAAPSAAPAAAASAPAPRSNGKLKASPRAKALAAARGISLAGLVGSGPGGRIIERDVAAAAPVTAQAAAPRTAAPAPVGLAAAGMPPGAAGVREVKVTGIRKLISERMLASLQGTAQLTMHTSADARSLQSMRKKLKESPEALGLRDVTINDMVLFAVSRVLGRFAEMNALFVGETLQLHASVNLGFAVDTARGLMVPVIRNAQGLSLGALAREASRLIKGCREGGITPAEMVGGTFTVSNLGTFGVQGFTPVLNAPQVGILGVGAIVPGALMGADGEVSFIPQMALSLTINHQVVDGAPGARFLQALGAAIGGFELLLAQ